MATLKLPVRQVVFLHPQQQFHAAEMLGRIVGQPGQPGHVSVQPVRRRQLPGDLRHPLAVLQLAGRHPIHPAPDAVGHRAGHPLCRVAHHRGRH